MQKHRIGIIFGGFSREREISFAGGRTVYDNLDKSLFEPVPLFLDSFGNFILLDWKYIYKGSIRDFYPPVAFLPSNNSEFQLYAESIGNDKEMIAAIGKKVEPRDLNSYLDFAFLCLHGVYGEDGKIQALLESLDIPYSGSGIRPSEIGMNKALQKELMIKAGFNSPQYACIKRESWMKASGSGSFLGLADTAAFPVVVKAANQGSSIGITILKEKSEEAFVAAVDKAFFRQTIKKAQWLSLDTHGKHEFIRTLCDIREGIGLPVRNGDKIISLPVALLAHLENEFETGDEIVLEAVDGETEVLIEGFIEGKEFSCIVIQDEDGNPIALPPTEIRKGQELFDYRSKYLPGLSRKITPIQVSDIEIESIRKECERLFIELGFDVYARIDGFLSKDGKVFLNDPNTTSGMMPSSFFFHQAAEIGLDPSRFLTYIIRTSLAQRMKAMKGPQVAEMLKELDENITHSHSISSKKQRVAVILGGYSSERHISVESGRNIYEKLASSVKYAPTPVFLTGSGKDHKMYHIPVKALLKDNADDIKEKIEKYEIHPVIQKIIDRCRAITKKYAGDSNLDRPSSLSYKDLAKQFDVVFIALHGRPGEDGAVQEQLEKVGLPYNGSGVESSRLTIDKFATNELLAKNGFLIAKHFLVNEQDWNTSMADVLARIKDTIGYPFIAKPVDDGCSSAVKKIKSPEEFEAFTKLIFRTSEELDAKAASLLKIRPKEEFPVKNVILVEELISKKDSKHFLEITGGMLTHIDAGGTVSYEVFEASEALAEGEVLSLEEKFLAGQGQNITPARYATDPIARQKISDKVKIILGDAAKLLNIRGYCRIDAFVRIWSVEKIEVVFIEVNSLPGMTPATCIFHQCAINAHKPFEFIDGILQFGILNNKKKKTA